MRRPNPQVAIWYPVGFAALLSLFKVVLPGGAGDPAFYCFLPMCFLGMAGTQMALLRRLEALEQGRSPTAEASKQ